MKGEEELDEVDECEGLKEPQDHELQQIKALIETLVGQEFLEFAYREEYTILRRMFVILQIGLGYSHLYEELFAILDRWAELKQCTTLDKAAREACCVSKDKTRLRVNRNRSLT